MNEFFTETPPPPASTPGGAPEPRKVGAGHGWRWIADAFALVRRQWLMWMLFGLVLVLIQILGKLIPLGPLVNVVVGPILSGGLMLAAHKGERGGELELADLFSGFRAPGRRLFGLGLAYLVFMVALLALMALLGVGTGLLGKLSAAPSVGAMWLVSLLLLVAGALFGLCAWLAPALVTLSGQAPLAALRTSLKAGLRNWLALTVCGLLLLLLAVLATIPFGLGLLLWLPLAHLTCYASWRDLFAGAPAGIAPRDDVIVG